MEDLSPIDNPLLDDNRDYRYAAGSRVNRSEYAPIADMITLGASVVDFGCGDGSLLELLRAQRDARGVGVEISSSGVEAAKSKGFTILQRRIDEANPDFRDGQFDFAVCNVTLQMVMCPEIALREMKRVARSQIISFPNFAYYRNRRDLLVEGRMPKPMLFGYNWYSTGHIHQFSHRDFVETATKLGLRVKRAEYLETSMRGIRGPLTRRFPNVFAMICVLQLEAET